MYKLQDTFSALCYSASYMWIWQLIIYVFIGLERDAVLQSDGAHAGTVTLPPCSNIIETVMILNNNTFIAADFFYW